MKDKILVTKSSMPTFNEYTEEIKDMWESHWLTNMGVKHQKLQEDLEKYLCVDNVELLVNGHQALEMSIEAFKLSGEIITTPFTFASTTHAIVRNGITPVFCDVNETDFTIDVNKIEDLITDKTTAILPVHVYGNVCNIEKIDEIAKKHNLIVIYDAAHTFGVKYKGRGIGDFGDASCFSFHATKVFNTIEGGAVAYKEKFIGERIYDLKNFGIHGPESVLSVGSNAKMNEFCAAMGICNLRHVDSEIAKRKVVYSRYYERLNEVSGLQLNPIQKEVTPNYAYFPVMFNPEEFGVDRNFVFDILEQNGIGARKYFYPLTNAFECYKGRFDATKTPVAKLLADRVLTLPLYADLSLETVDKICDIILGLKK